MKNNTIQQRQNPPNKEQKKKKELSRSSKTVSDLINRRSRRLFGVYPLKKRNERILLK